MQQKKKKKKKKKDDKEDDENDDEEDEHEEEEEEEDEEEEEAKQEMSKRELQNLPKAFLFFIKTPQITKLLSKYKTSQPYFLTHIQNSNPTYHFLLSIILNLVLNFSLKIYYYYCYY
jgi:magnesium-transporting ATPase (P-type)